MEFEAVVRKRRMVRRFASEPPVATSSVRDLLGLATRAPSAGNTQAWDFVVLRDAADRADFWAASTPPDAADSAWLEGVSRAPTLILCLSDETAYRRRYAERDKGAVAPDDQEWPIPYWHTDVAGAALLILLGATERDLAALFFGVPPGRHDQVRRTFLIPPDRAIVGVVALGHESERVRSPSLRRPRRALADVTHWGRFGAPQDTPGAASARMPARMDHFAPD